MASGFRRSAREAEPGRRRRPASAPAAGIIALCASASAAGVSSGLHSTIMTSKPGHDSAQVDGTEGRIFIDPLELDSDHITMETHEGR